MTKLAASFLDRKTINELIDCQPIACHVDSLTCYDFTDENDLLARCQGQQILITNKVVVTETLMRQLPELKLICVAATGYNNIDVAAAKALGIAVTNVAGYGNQSVAQYVFAHILNYTNQPQHHYNNTQQGLWQQSQSFCYFGEPSFELAGKTLTIVGHGALGQTVANLARAFNMQVLIAERPNTSAIRSGRVAFEQAIAQADIISIHCPLTTETIHLFDQQVLALMKPTAILVNTARGAIVEPHALVAALKAKQFALAIIDVLDQEPPPADHPLITTQLDNLKVTAHIAWASLESQQRLINGIADNISAFNMGKRLNRID